MSERENLAFRVLIAAGGSLIVIEHNLDVIKTADYLIDPGPEVGHIVATGQFPRAQTNGNHETII